MNYVFSVWVLGVCLTFLVPVSQLWTDRRAILVISDVLSRVSPDLHYLIIPTLFIFDTRDA